VSALSDSFLGALKMAKTNSPAVTFTPTVVSISDGGYQQAKAQANSQSIVRQLMGLIPGLGSVDDPYTDEIKDELRKGYAKSWHELNPSRYFVSADGNWVECESEQKMLSHAKADKFVLDVHVAFNYSQQAFGALKNEEPAKHDLIGQIRTKFNKYVSNRLRDLKNDAKKIFREDNGIKNDRAPTALFYEWLTAPDKGALALIRQRCINAKAKGDETADLAKLDKALASFKGALK
jgi:hypothetical protein